MAKTKKQVVSGYHRPVCVECRCEFRPEKNGVGILDMNDNSAYELWDADLWKCPICGFKVVGGFGNSSVSAHYEPNFKTQIKWYEDHSQLIRNNG